MMLPAGTPPRAGRVEREDRLVGAVEVGARLQRHVDELAEAVLADADVRPARCRVGALDQLAGLDLATERRLRRVSMSKKSPLTPAAAPARLAMLLRASPCATCGAVSRSDLTARLDRSTVRTCSSYQPDELRNFWW